mmetsp:Transcript_7933/g.16065  ORF Transcript_7933/g.16065 Transcript_7933/m.16065 type:complete len:766 (+) Transcript_7933:594-2891(+)
MGFGGGAVSFHDDDNEEDAADEQAYSTMRSNTANIGDATCIGQADGDNAKEQDASRSMYDSAALKVLKSKQKAYIAPPGEKEDVKKVPEQADDGAQMGQEHSQQQSHPVSNGVNKGLGDGETNFIPIAGSSIVAGDEALAYMEEEEDERDGTADPSKRKDKRTTIGTDRLSNLTGGIGTEKDHSTVLGVGPGRRNSTDIDIDDSGRKWEDEVARRAGLGARAGGERGGPVSKQKNGEDASHSSPAASLETMRTTISKTVTHLRQRREDLESTHDRRQNELEGVQNELRRQEDDLRGGGMSFEYYQNLRLDIADWVGALRNLSTKVETISSAIREQEAESCDRRRVRRRQREDDVAAILQSEGLLDSIVGRKIQLDSNSDATAPSVDEFGRDIKSAEVLARERRIIRRRRVNQESSQRRKGGVANDDVPSDTDADMSDNEIEEQDQRMNALDEAMLLAKSEMDDKYTSLEELQKIFLSWANQHPEDYERCYAKLSLADLAAVLVKANTCTKINTIQSSNSLIRDLLKSEWVRTISSFENAEINSRKDEEEEKSTKNNANAKEEEKLISAISRKVVLPYFLSLLKDESLYDPLSSRQTESMMGLYAFLNSTLAGDVGTFRNITKGFVATVKESLGAMAILVVRPDLTHNGTRQEGEDVKEAVTFAAVEQVYRLQKWIKNVVAISSELDDNVSRRDLATVVLMEAIASRLLPLLAHWKDMESLGDQKAQIVIQEVCSDLKKVGWLDDDSLMLQAAPLRACAQRYGVDV